MKSGVSNTLKIMDSKKLPKEQFEKLSVESQDALAQVELHLAEKRNRLWKCARGDWRRFWFGTVVAAVFGFVVFWYFHSLRFSIWVFGLFLVIAHIIARINEMERRLNALTKLFELSEQERENKGTAIQKQSSEPTPDGP